MTDKIKFTRPLNVKPDEPTINNRVYPKDVLRKACEEFVAKRLPVYMGAMTTELPSWESACCIIDKMKEEDGQYLFDATALATASGALLAEMLQAPEASAFEFNFCGSGSLDDNDVVQTDFKILRMGIAPKEMS